VLYALMDFVVDQYLPVVQYYEEQVQEIEEEILDGVASTESTARIYRLKRDLLALRRAVTPLVEVCNRLMRFDIPQIPAESRPYFRTSTITS
jgi:magnesium transporter